MIHYDIDPRSLSSKNGKTYAEVVDDVMHKMLLNEEQAQDTIDKSLFMGPEEES